MLQLKNLSRIYQTDEVETAALNQVNIEIEQGEFVAIMGPSGCGKSTLLGIVGMLDIPSGGQYIFKMPPFGDSHVSASLPIPAMARRGLQRCRCVGRAAICG